MNRLRIATRRSALALRQANHVKGLLEAAHANLRCEIMAITTQGDRDKVSPLHRLGGKGVFVKELETALRDGSADLAVHSMKDVPVELPAGLEIGAVVAREKPNDALVSNRFASLADLPQGARVGSSSLRRVLQIQQAHPRLRFADLRGNVDTRLRKLDQGQYDAIIVAVAGLVRLGLGARITEQLPTEVCLPAAGQGALGVECRAQDPEVGALVGAINDADAATCVGAERKVAQILGATCNLPIAVHAGMSGGSISIAAFVASPDGARVIRDSIEGPRHAAAALAQELGGRLMAQGAGRMTGG